MAFRLDRLKDAMSAKNVDRIKLQQLTGISSDQMGRILSGERKPGDDKIGRLTIHLELDADYLLDTDRLYESMDHIRAVAHMSLSRFITEETLDTGRQLTADALDRLRHVADHHSTPPMWINEWRRQHESFSLDNPRTPDPQRASVVMRSRRRGSMTS